MPSQMILNSCWRFICGQKDSDSVPTTRTTGSQKELCLAEINACARSLCLNNWADLAMPKTLQKVTADRDPNGNTAQCQVRPRHAAVVISSLHSPTFSAHSPVTFVTKQERGSSCKGLLLYYQLVQHLVLQEPILDRAHKMNSSCVWILASLPLAHAHMHIHTYT